MTSPASFDSKPRRAGCPSHPAAPTDHWAADAVSGNVRGQQRKKMAGCEGHPALRRLKVEMMRLTITGIYS